MFYFGLAAIICALDLRIKKWISKQLNESFPIDLANGHIQIRKVKNRGLALNLFQNRKFISKLLSGITLLVVLIAALKAFFVKDGRIGYKIGLALILGGGASNTIERFKEGAVTDYISFPKSKIKRIRRIVYNIGDLAIFAGVIITFFSFISRKLDD